MTVVREFSQVVEEEKSLTVTNTDGTESLQRYARCQSCKKNLTSTDSKLHISEICGLKQIKCETLWFLESFGLTLDSVKVKDKDGKVTELDYGTYNGTSFQNLSQEGQDTVRSLLYIMDKFCVGDAGYHEVSMVVDDVPRSYLIKQCRSDLNKIFHISKTPGKHAGAQMSFKEELRVQIKKKRENGDLGKTTSQGIW
ncbi:uncharacterized protein LOC144648487 [Oculina patagonica]